MGGWDGTAALVIDAVIRVICVYGDIWESKRLGMMAVWVDVERCARRSMPPEWNDGGGECAARSAESLG